MRSTYKTEADLESDMLLFFTESKDMSEAKNELNKRGLSLLRHHQRSYLAQCYEQLVNGNYGRMDLTIIDTTIVNGKRTVYVDIIELKNESLNANHLAQICRYNAGVFQAIQDIRFTQCSGYEIITKLHLIGTDFSAFNDTDLSFLPFNMQQVNLYRYSINPFQGLIFYPLNFTPRDTKAYKLFEYFGNTLKQRPTFIPSKVFEGLNENRP